MQTRRIHTSTIGAAVLSMVALLSTTPEAGAQSTVSIDSDRIEILDTDGDSAVLLDNGADYTAGGNGRTANLNLRASDGPTTLFYNAFQAQLILGGGTHEGIVLLRDDNGTTTTIEADGRTGAVYLGGNGEDGDLIVYDNTDSETFRINGQTGSATNAFGANGLVKAWARMNADGTVLSCWRCDSAATFRLAAGAYIVSFAPLGLDIHSRPRSAVIDSHDTGVSSSGVVRLANSSATTVLASTGSLPLGDAADRPFTVFIF